MNIDVESIGLLSLILQDSPKDRQLILCVLARSNATPARITFNPNTDYPTFYGYSNSRIPSYLMDKGVFSNVPREGQAKRLLSSHYLSYAETIMNGSKNWDLSQKFESVSKFVTLENKTVYKDAEVFLVFRDKASSYIKGFTTSQEPEYQEFTGRTPAPIQTTTPKNPPIIKSKTLELIAQIIGNTDTGTNLITFLTNCGVDNKLIEYPQTKWRMVNEVLQTLAISKNPKDFRILYKIIEEACHPLTHNGNEEQAKEITNKFNNLLKYDDIYLEGSKLFRKSENCDDEWISSDGEVIEAECSLIMPQDIAKLYVFWNELIKMTKFYLLNPNKQSDELNEIYFELIKEIEDTLEKKQCGELHLSYKRPFKNLIGCEYEVKKTDQKTDDILINLFSFFGEITATNLPTKEFVEDTKTKDKILLDKIEVYIKNHTPEIKDTKEKMTVDNQLSQQTKEPLHIVIDEVKKDIGIKGLEEKVILQKPKNKKIQLRKFPAGLKWEEISIQFLNEHEVIVKAKNETLQATYEVMGFQDEKKKLPNKQWQFLHLLALKKGEVSWENNQDLPLKQINSIKKQKQLLTETLKAYFQIYDSEPFHNYKTEKAYRIKVTLTPEPEPI